MRGILGAAGYVPYRRLQRSEIREVMCSGGGKGTRSVASFDEDTTTMAVEACRNLSMDLRPDAVFFATAEPAYLDKTNANAIHTALRLDDDVLAVDMGGAIRSGIGALRAALDSNNTTLVVSSDMRTGLPTSADESQGGDAAAALLVGEGDVVAEFIGSASATREFLERWRTPGSFRSRTWEDRFGEAMYAPLAEQAWSAALKDAGTTEVDVLCVAGMHARSVARVSRKLGVDRVVDLSSTVGDAGTAQAMLLLAAALETAEPGQTIALVSLSDGADVVLFRAVKPSSPKRTVAAQIEQAADVPYTRFLSWRGMLTPEPPNRPEPSRVSAPAAARGSDWKFGFEEDGRPLADVPGTVVTFTVDRLAHSPSPPIVFAIVDFDAQDAPSGAPEDQDAPSGAPEDQDAPSGAPSDGGRFPLELTDVDAEQLKVGDRVEMTFRKLSTADGIHNYFWKARPLR